MKSLKESLFDSKTQTMESLFDKDLAQEDLSEHELVIAIIKTYLLQIKNIAHELDYNIIDNSCSGYRGKYPNITINFNKSQIPIEIHAWGHSIKNELLKNKSFKFPVRFVGNDSKTIIIDFWRTLKESLDEGLFDDNITKELTIRQTHDLTNEPGIRGIRASGVPIAYVFDVKKLLKYPNPYNREGSASNNSLNYLIGIVADQPVPSKSSRSEREKWGKNMKKVLSKYIARVWKKEWDDKIEVYVKNWSYGSSPGYFSVVISYDDDAGTYEIVFKPKQ